MCDVVDHKITLAFLIGFSPIRHDWLTQDDTYLRKGATEPAPPQSNR
jgi:hypothetical protein